MVVQHHTGIDKGLNSLSGLLSLPNMAFSTYCLFVQCHVMRTVSCYPIAWAMRIVDRTGNNPYYILKDHLGYASVVTDAGDGPAPTGTGGNGGGGGGNPHDDDDFDPNPNCTDCNIYNPIGDYVTGYNGAGGGLTEDTVNSVGGDGECTGSVCSFSGGSVPLNYSASYDVILYEGLLILTIHESYWMPGYAPPLLEIPTLGGSVLLSYTGIEQEATALGYFLPGNNIDPEDLQHRDTTIHFRDERNFPDQLVIRVTFGAAGMGYESFLYQLHYEHP